MRGFVLALILLVMIAVLFAVTFSEASESSSLGKVVSPAEFTTIAREIWNLSLDCVKCASRLSTLDPEAKQSYFAAQQRVMSAISAPIVVPSQYAQFYGNLREFANNCSSFANSDSSPTELQQLLYTQSWSSTLKQRSLIIGIAEDVDIKLVDRSGVNVLEEQIAEFSDGYPAERSDDPALSVAWFILDDLLRCQSEWAIQRKNGKKTNYQHYYRILCGLYRNTETLETEPPEGWMDTALAAILATFDAMQKAQKGQHPDLVVLRSLTAKFQSSTKEWMDKPQAD